MDRALEKLLLDRANQMMREFQPENEFRIPVGRIKGQRVVETKECLWCHKTLKIGTKECRTCGYKQVKCEECGGPIGRTTQSNRQCYKCIANIDVSLASRQKNRARRKKNAARTGRKQ